MEKLSTDTTAALAALSLKKSVEDNGSDDHGAEGNSVENCEDSDDLSSISDEPPTPTMTATIFRRKHSDPSLLTKLGINELVHDPVDEIFFAHPAGSPTTPAIVAKAPIPDNGKG